MDPWRELEPAWRAAFELAWDAYVVPTIPVGAVVTDADGAILTRGRNRIFDTAAPPGELFGTRLAHAEINALVQLGTDRRYLDCTLWTTLEPCAQCIAAAWIGRIGRVVFAAPDFYGGSSRLIERELEAADNARTFPLLVEGPLGGLLERFSEVLWMDYFLRHRPELEITDLIRARRPEIAELAARLPLAELVGAPLDEAFPRIWDEL
jgi:tRNA(adenine34) deaminase